MDRQMEVKTYLLIPKKIAQRCPVCNGFGTLKYGQKVCQACEGKGYILVPARIDGGKREYDSKVG